MSYNLPKIIFYIKLHPFITIFYINTETHKIDDIKDVEIKDLPNHIQNIIKDRIKHDFHNIISNTLAYNYNVSTYDYDDHNNLITMKIIFYPSDIKHLWFKKLENVVLPEKHHELIDTVINDVIKDISHLYGDLAEDTWKGGDLNLYQENDKEYDINLKLISIDYDIEHDNGQLHGGFNTYLKKYIKYKSKYLHLKKRIAYHN